MPEMKDSGIEWIGEIPEDWEIPKIGYYYSLHSGDTLTSIDIDATEGDYSVFGANGKRGFFSKFNTEGKHILLGRVGALCGNVHIIDGKNWVTEHALILSKKRECNDEYCGYIFETLNLGRFSKSSAQPVISADTISHLKFVLPIIAEQQRIADFLDAKCAEIDALTADIEKEIEVLEEYKKTVIFHTVMEGIGHSSFKTTESVIWKTIPAEWELKDIKYIFEIVKRIAGKEGYDIVAITQKGLKIKDISTNEGQIAADYSGYQFVYPGDFAMNHMDLLSGWVDLSDLFGVTSPDYRVFRLRDVLCNDHLYWKYVMQCCYMCQIFYALGQGVSNLGRWRLPASEFNNFKVPVPPYEEQVQIGRYLEGLIAGANDTIEQKQKQLSVLADYKKSLIYEYVTGKKEVSQ